MKGQIKWYILLSLKAELLQRKLIAAKKRWITCFEAFRKKTFKLFSEIYIDVYWNYMMKNVSFAFRVFCAFLALFASGFVWSTVIGNWFVQSAIRGGTVSGRSFNDGSIQIQIEIQTQLQIQLLCVWTIKGGTASGWLV